MAVETQTMTTIGDHPMDDSAELILSNGTKEPALRFASGLILPPPEIKSVIDRTALFVARSANPPMFEDKIRENQRQDPKFSFLNPADPYHAYYRHRMDRIAAGEEIEEVQPDKERTEGVDKVKPLEDVGVEPPQPQFVLDIPNITPIDLDIMKLTALFTARRGRGFLAALSQREGRNYQFDFLRPNHSLFGYFNRLVEQYQKVLYPSKEMLAQLHERAQEGAQWKALEQSRKYARWERLKQEKDRKRQDDQEAEKRAFAEIDWHDYAIVQTIEFTAADANTELPPPMSLQEVENMTLAQKRMAAMIMENTADDIEAHRARQAAAEAEAAAAVGSAGGGVVAAADDLDEEDAAMEESEDEDEEAHRKKREEEERIRELERAKAIQASANVTGPMKIKTDYVPKLGSKKNATLTTCAICGQQIPVDELDEHMRIELLDPKWKSQRDALEARKVQASELLRGANVVTSLKNLASTRVDIFGTEADEERRKREEEEERVRRKEREKVVWDGHTATKVSTMDKYSTNVNFDEQIAAIHRAKGLGPQEPNAIGPGIGPAAAPPPPITTLPPPPASLPAPPAQGAAASATFATATVSSGPQPASAFQPPPVMLPPLHYQGLDAAQPFGFQPPPPGMHPARMPGPPPQTGTVRSADQIEGLEEQPQIKRQKIAKLPGGALYPEADWVSMHPYTISLNIQLPSDPSKPEWKLEGQVVTVSDLPLTLLVSTLRDRFLQTTGSTLPASRIRLSFMGKMLTNSNTIAFYNLEDEDLIALSVSAEKKKR
ncbi:Pre-mRNA splicing factor PRP21 like protein-domain-containing protein [Pisolithus thermaeus]|nr:Pre-mRNA splicing factor PRP21 like protein-domain-containing protein [Pisolithus croceorrhizus]KAI6167092.1 Pre-mRNA splicing factor PRP21 like protein-domain-containing protein [Pisolithus thermaeus]